MKHNDADLDLSAPEDDDEHRQWTDRMALASRPPELSIWPLFIAVPIILVACYGLFLIFAGILATW
jgi:hypothetical protein